MELVELIKIVRSGVAQIHIVHERNLIGSGSGFLVEGGLVTNSHVIRGREIDSIMIRFDDTDPNDQSAYIRVAPNDCVAIESPENEKDFVFLNLEEAEFEGRHHFKFSEKNDMVEVGNHSIFLGFPFAMTQLTCHIGFISSVHYRKGVKVIQIDGSINGGNSGGPLLDINSGEVVGIVTRAVTGLIEDQFNNLLQTLRQNQEVLNRAKTVMSISGVDPIQALKVSQASMEQIATSLKRSANVGIGYAYCVEYIRDALKKI
jgi:hypothetical protein